MDDASLVNYSPVMSREQSPPADPCDFIKTEHTNTFFPPPPPPPLPPSQTQPTLSFQAAPHLVASAQQHHLPPALLSGTLMATVTGGQFINIPQSSVIMTPGKFPTSHAHATIQGGCGLWSALPLFLLMIKGRPNDIVYMHL